jgi:hypothetical protein
MNTRIIWSLIVGVAMLAACANNISAAEAAKDDKAIFDKLVTAVKQADYESFVEDGDDSFKQKTTQDQFDAAVRQVSVRLNAGYQATYLGAIKKSGGHVLLWQLTLKGVEDELQVTARQQPDSPTTDRKQLRKAFQRSRRFSKQVIDSAREGVPETKGLALEQIKASWQPSGKNDHHAKSVGFALRNRAGVLLREHACSCGRRFALSGAYTEAFNRMRASLTWMTDC